MTPDQALANLQEGNSRFANGKIINRSPRDLVFARINVRNEQQPVAIVIACADSRVAPEFVFDQGLGALFDVRTAGNVVDAIARGSVEYAVHHLRCPLIVVLGHERCGAVTAAVRGSDEPGDIATVLEAIQPAVKDSTNQSGDRIANAVRSNAVNVMMDLTTESSLVREAIESNTLGAVAAYYDLDTGRCQWLSGTPGLLR